MKMSQRGRKALVNMVMLALFVTTLLVAALSAGWALPLAVGQTIPFPTETPTPKPTDIPIPTSTWTPYPTWTPVLTKEPVQPTATATPEVTPFTPTPTPASVQPLPVTSPTEPLPAASPAWEPAALVLKVFMEPQIAGPSDEVHFLVQVANVGRGPAHGVKLEAEIPHDLLVRAIDCDRCAISLESGRLTLSTDDLSSGAQLLASILTEVGEDAWPGQAVLAVWTVTADQVLPQSVQASLELPWAELPATGEVDGVQTSAGRKK